ncbi:hypothetical protein SO802_013687 [Lithocarpus litseifolius]|uniref:Uncharacterized protein n=1 Tax=Lithocarpus litseifolius TaxID=425828 RepID=A0AAW2DBS9_9ROSI
MEQSIGSVTAAQNNSPTVLAQNSDEVELLANKLENVACELREKELTHEEIRSANPTEINSVLNSPKKAAKLIIDPKETLHFSTFHSKVAEIEVVLPNLKAGPCIINKSLIDDFSIKEHVNTEGVKKAARFYQDQEAITHASTYAAKVETQETLPPRQQGSWKRVNRTDASNEKDRITSTAETTLSTKRVYEELSHPNGLPSKKRAVDKLIVVETIAIIGSF